MRIYDEELKAFVQSEATRCKVRESEIVADAVRLLQQSGASPIRECLTYPGVITATLVNADGGVVGHAHMQGGALIIDWVTVTDEVVSEKPTVRAADAVRAAYRAVLYDEVPQHTADDLIEAAEARVGKTGSVAHVTHGRGGDLRVDATRGGGIDDRARGRSTRSRVGQAASASRRHTGGSDAGVDEVHAATDDAVPSGDASDRPAAAADVVSREAVVQPVPAVDPERGVVLTGTVFGHPERLAVSAAEAAEILAREPEPVQRVKGPDSGPDEKLGF